MIGRLDGMLLEKQPPSLLIDVKGVGYEVDVSMNTFYKLPDINKNVILYIHFVVREDAQLLYGFYDLMERSLFKTLIKVNGVGPKLALTILSSVCPNEFCQFVTDNNTSALVRLPGVGKKTAERLIIEMRDRLKNSDFDTPNANYGLSSDILPLNNTPEKEAISALVALGYKPQEASKAVNKLDVGGLRSQEIIRLALKNAAMKH